MTRSLAIAPLLLAAVALTACGGGDGDGASPGVDAACDTVGVQEEIEHIVHESALQFGAFETLACSGDWTFAIARIDSPDGDQTQTFVFRQQDGMYVLKAPEIVCGTVGDDPSVRPDDAELPAGLWDVACVMPVSE